MPKKVKKKNLKKVKGKRSTSVKKKKTSKVTNVKKIEKKKKLIKPVASTTKQIKEPEQKQGATSVTGPSETLQQPSQNLIVYTCSVCGKVKKFDASANVVEQDIICCGQLMKKS